MRRRLGCGEGAVRREIGVRIDGQQVDPRHRAGLAIRAARAHGRAELLREAQQAEVVHVHLRARGFHSLAVGDAEAAVHLGIVDEDVHLARDLRRGLAHVLRVGDVEGQQRHLREVFQFVEAGEFLPGLAVADPDDFRSRLGEGLGQGLAQRVLPSVMSTLRCFGSQVNSRSCRSSAISAFSFSGSAAITACPARSSAALTFTRCFTDSWR